MTVTRIIRRRKIEGIESNIDKPKPILKLIKGGKRKIKKVVHQRKSVMELNLTLKSINGKTEGNICITSGWLYYYAKNKKNLTYKLTLSQLGELLQYCKIKGKRRMLGLIKDTI